MIEKAKRKVPEARFRIADMINLRLEENFDVITCLFSAIGYAQNLTGLAKTFQGFHKHLNDKGMAIVEPWVFKKDFKKGTISLDTVEDEKVKFVRMATSKMSSSEWLVYMHYLIGIEGEIKYFTEVHKMLAADYQDYVEAFKLARFKDTTFLKENIWNGCRGLFVAME